jgi:hypothetical protein
MGDEPVAKALLYTGQHKHGINAERQPCLEWDSNPRFKCLSWWRNFVPQTARALWSASNIMMLVYCGFEKLDKTALVACINILHQSFHSKKIRKISVGYPFYGPIFWPNNEKSSSNHNPSNRTMALGSTQPLTEMSTRNLPGGVKKRPAHMADNLTAICEPNV